MLKHEAGKRAPEDSSEQDAAERTSRGILCAACDHRITNTDEGIEVAGRHHHTCVNPANHVYRIACYAHAPGAIGEGAWSDDYSWFKGYWWQLALCGACACHVGWVFSGDDDFWGLIRRRVRES